MAYAKDDLQRILALQRAAFIAEGAVSLETRKERVSRLALTLLKNMQRLAAALSDDYGHRPVGLTKAFESLSWSEDLLRSLDQLEGWMAPVEVEGGFIQQKPKGVVGIIGAWNFPITLTFEPALSALAAGNRVMVNYSEFHPRTGKLLADLIGDAFPEDEFAFVHGDLETAQAFSTLRFDHLFFTGSPKVGSIVSAEAGRNLVPVTMELGGKNPVVVAEDADFDLAASRLAATRMLNSGQICLCPDYAFVPRQRLDDFAKAVEAKLRSFYPTYLENPNVVSIVNDRNYQRVVGLVDDAVAKGATKIVAAPANELDRLPDAVSRRIPPTILTNVPDDAHIASEEVFGPVLTLYPYDTLDEAIAYIAQRPTPLASYWYGNDNAAFHAFLDRTDSGGVTINDALVHAMLPDAPFGGSGNSGSGAYHGKAGFDTFTHRRTVANVTQAQGVANALVDGTALTPEALSGIDGAIETMISRFEAQSG
jgi:coniferyl-aldehyde dehydrogenase